MLSFHVDAMVTHGSDFSGTKVGDFQTVSNVQAETLPHIYEAWTEATLTPSLVAKAGLVDLMQYVFDPGWDASVKPALVVGMRISLAWPAG